MYVSTSLTRDEMTDVLETVSADYLNSLTWELEDLGGVRRNRYRLKVGAISGGYAARTSASGRRGPYACWHAFRDVLSLLMIRDPRALVRTSLARYDGAAGFIRDYPGTADKNIGSMIYPAYMPELCDHWHTVGSDLYATDLQRAAAL